MFIIFLSKSPQCKIICCKFYIVRLFFVLEFEVDEIRYIIKRNVDENRRIKFGHPNNLQEYDIDSLKRILGELVFYRKDYIGKFFPTWYRSLISFYLKVQKFKREQFNDPIKYVKDMSEVEINVYQLYLLGLDNTLAYENFKTKTDLKKILPAIKQIESLLKEKYDLQSLNETNQNINKLRYEIKKLLIKYDYPPVKRDSAVQLVIRQAELQCKGMIEE